jgi:hypothetical protein
MAQHDYNLANQSGAALRADLNDALSAIVSNNSGATEPATTFAYQLWADTTAAVLKQRNAANNAWVTLFKLADGAVPSVQTQLATRFTAGGTADAITGTLSPAIASYAAGLRVTATPSGANTVTGPTLNLNSLGTKTIKKRDSGGTKVALAAGDYNASGPFDLEYDGTDFILMNPLGAASSSQHGQCRLTKSGANLLLSPFNGNKLIINGTVQTIPAAGVTLAAPATNGTLYYIYAYWTGGAIALEYSTTGHATDSTTGVEIKSGDATRTLVGMARTVSSAWADSSAQRFVLSYFNRRPITSINNLGSTAATSSGSFVELNSSYRAEFLTWADSAIQAGGAGAATHGTAGYVGNYYACGVDGSTSGGLYTQFTTPGVGPVANASCLAGISLADGYHYVTPMGATSSGTVTFQATYTNVSAIVQG